MRKVTQTNKKTRKQNCGQQIHRLEEPPEIRKQRSAWASNPNDPKNFDARLARAQ